MATQHYQHPIMINKWKICWMSKHNLKSFNHWNPGDHGDRLDHFLKMLIITCFDPSLLPTGTKLLLFRYKTSLQVSDINSVACIKKKRCHRQADKIETCASYLKRLDIPTKKYPKIVHFLHSQLRFAKNAKILQWGKCNLFQTWC